jgi:hypothetical protein
MIPIRTCVGCGSRAPQPELMRFVSAGTGLAWDPGHRAPGRGAYLHPQPACWDAFVRRRGAVRSLRATPARAERERLVAALVSRESATG